MAKKKRSAREKLAGEGERKLVDMPPSWVERLGPGKLLIPLPADIDSAIRAIPAGTVKPMSEIRDEVGRQHGAATSCPLVSGIFWRLLADAAEENRSEGQEDLTPYWRVVKESGKLNEKLPGGIEGHAALLAAEGVDIARTRTGQPFVSK